MIAQAESSAGNSAFGDAERLALLDSFENYDLGWLWATDADHRIIYLSQSAKERLDAHDTVIGQSLADLCETTTPDGIDIAERPLTFFLGSHIKFRELPVRIARDEEEMWWQLSGRPYFDENDGFAGFHGSARDITRQFARQRDESRLALFDPLTGLANRQRIEVRLQKLLANFRNTGRACSLLMMDLDKFKRVNDTLGHPVGDELLRQVAQRLQRMVPPRAEIGRLGGDAFQIVLPDMADRGYLGELGQRIVQMISQPYSLDGSRVIIGASIGIAIAPFDGASADDLVRNANLALDACKRSGRGRFRFYASELANEAQRQKELSDLLAEALVADELELHYQPIVRSGSNRAVAFEALMRWQSPEIGSVDPATFIAVAEDANLINQLGEWSLLRACSDAVEWPGDLGVSVNISTQHFFSGLLPAAVSKALAASGLNPGRLQLEIGEGVFLGEPEIVDITVKELRQFGASLVLDDFGTGYCSLANLRRVPFQKIKVDQKFVRHCCEPGNPNAAVISAIVSLANELDMIVMAEGVESMDELKLVTKRGASLMQGFIFSRPVPHHSVMTKLGTGDFVYEPLGPQHYRSERRALYQRIGVIHDDNRYRAVLRNLSQTGALIEGLLDVPVGTDLILDFGEGQLAFATVRRSQDATQGVVFQEPLVKDGAGGWCTRRRLSPHALAKANLRTDSGKDAIARSTRRFMQVDVTAGSSRAA